MDGDGEIIEVGDGVGAPTVGTALLPDPPHDVIPKAAMTHNAMMKRFIRYGFDLHYAVLVRSGATKRMPGRSIATLALRGSGCQLRS